MTREIVNKILRNEDTQYYHQWKYSEDEDVRYALASCGHFPEYFIDDLDFDTALITLINHPEYYGYISAQEDSGLLERAYLAQQQYIDIDVLEKHLQKIDSGPDFHIKLKALKYQPTTMETTMNVVQLYQADCPLWALRYSPEQIDIVLMAQKAITDKGLGQEKMEPFLVEEPKTSSLRTELIKLKTA